MAKLTDRLLTPKVANAMMSPTGIVLAGGAAAAVIVSGAPLLFAPVAALGAWALRVGAAVERPPKLEDLDYRRISSPWQQFVVDAMVAERRFAAIDRGRHNERLDDMGETVQQVVRRSYELAQEGERLSKARALIDTKSLQRERDAAGSAGASSPAVTEALDAQLATARRLDAAIAELVDRLTVIDARLGELVARAIELSARSDTARLTPIEGELTALVDELEAVRLATAELG